MNDRLAAALADRYRIERELGAGGMATVYLAADLKHDRKVAIKVLKPELAAVLGAERFVQEIKTTAALSHPHILPLFDSGEAGGFLYYVMPYIQGETIRDRLNRETQLGIDEAVKIATEVADALDYAHRNGVIHRDIKPENILLHDGRPMVMDFGIALAVSAAAGGRMTETGLSLGTPHYMSPEQATADRIITARSDVYSLASVLYEMLTGEPPHMGTSAQQIIMKIIADVPRPAMELRKSVPQHVSAALAQALQKLPADRFDSARTFADALKNPAFSTTTVMGALAPASARNRWTMVAGAAAAGVILGAVAMKLLAPPGPALRAITRDQLTFTGQAHMPAISPDGQRVAYIVDACEMGAIGCTISLEVLEVGATRAQTLIAGAQQLSYPRWSADGETVVVAGSLGEGRVGLFSIPRLSATPKLIHQGDVSAYDTHPAGDSVLVLRGAGEPMFIVGLDGTVHARIPVKLQEAIDAAWSPDGSRIAVNDGDGLHVLDRSGTVLGSSPSTGMRDWFRWATGGSALIYFRTGRAREDELVRREVRPDGTIGVEQVVIMPRIPTMYQGEFDLARQSGRLVVMTGDPITDLWSFDLRARPVRGVQETHGTTWYGSPTPSLDDRSLLFFRGDALGDNVYRLDRVTGAEEALTAEAGPGHDNVRVASAGDRIVYARVGEPFTLEVMELPSTRVTSLPSPLLSTAVPIARTGVLALRMPDGGLVVLDSLTGEWRTLAALDSLEISRVAASPDGRRAIFVGSRVRGRGTGSFLASVPVEGGDLTMLESSEVPELPRGVSVGADGSIYVGRWLLGEPGPSLWRMTGARGPLTRLADLRPQCRPESLIVGWSGQLAVCAVDDFRSDIWTFDLGTLTR